MALLNGRSVDTAVKMVGGLGITWKIPHLVVTDLFDYNNNVSHLTCFLLQTRTSVLTLRVIKMQTVRIQKAPMFVHVMVASAVTAILAQVKKRR